MNEEKLHYLARLVMQVIDPEIKLSLDEFVDVAKMSREEKELCETVLSLFDDESKLSRINRAEDADQLSSAIKFLADSNGEIQGRSRKFNAQKMASFVEGVISGNLPATLLTREYGIRQQAIYIRESEKIEKSNQYN